MAHSAEKSRFLGFACRQYICHEAEADRQHGRAADNLHWHQGVGDQGDDHEKKPQKRQIGERQQVGRGEKIAVGQNVFVLLQQVPMPGSMLARASSRLRNIP